MDQSSTYKNLKYKTLRRKYRNIEGNLYDIKFGEVVSNMTPKAQATKEKDKLYFIKIKAFCTSKDTIKRAKRQPIDRKKIFANRRSEKGLISRKYNEFLQLSNKKPT